jgi:hypothetical protein
MKKITLMLLLISSLFVNAQRTCGVDEVMSTVMSHPVQRQLYLKQQSNFEVELQNLESAKSAATTTIRIPVAVHFPSAGSASSSLKTCLRALAQNQINILNADFNATNADISQWANVSSLYPMVTACGNLNVQFVLATQNHPMGYGLVEGQPAVTFGYNFAEGVPTNQPMYDYNWTGYLNFVVKNIGSSLLGYAPLGGSPSQGHAVAINTFCFGSTGNGCSGYTPSGAYNLGRTTTHELGHYFNLNHTFNTGSCSTASCTTQGDRICDTPQVAAATYGCPMDGGVAGCSNGEVALTMNYMDYTNDACMYMYTQGQEQRMRAWYNAIAGQFNMTTLSRADLVKNNYTISPNPSNGIFTINFKDLTDDYSVEVFDVSGRVVFEKNYNQTSDLSQMINISNSSKGLYFVNVKSGSSISTEKILLQ